jgi:hypothetical protein
MAITANQHFVNLQRANLTPVMDNLSSTVAQPSGCRIETRLDAWRSLRSDTLQQSRARQRAVYSANNHAVHTNSMR